MPHEIIPFSTSSNSYIVLPERLRESPGWWWQPTFLWQRVFFPFWVLQVGNYQNQGNLACQTVVHAHWSGKA